MGALVTFNDEENRQRALKVLNEDCKFKGRMLRASKCKAHADPYEKAQVQTACRLVLFSASKVYSSKVMSHSLSHMPLN